jgi:8-oxo-dGTP pyrophosphatase MutT (NUDIX family)
MFRVAHLRQLLDAHAPQDARELRHRDRMCALLELGPGVFDREHYAPGHVTASAFIVDASRQHLLLILHEKFRLWLQPGGHVESTDAHVVAAVQREIAEETGLHGLPLAAAGLFDLDVHAIPARASAPAHEHFDVRFLFEAPYAAGQAGSDARALRWFPIAQLLSADRPIEFPTDDSVMRAVRKLHAGSA